MVPAAVASILGGDDFLPPAGGEMFDDPAPVEVPEGFNRAKIAQGFQDLMGNDLDIDGVAGDLIQGADGDMILWGLDPKAERVAVVPNLQDWTDPSRWLEALDAMDLPDGIETAIERLARSATVRMDSEGEEEVRRDFARRLAGVLRDAGLETLAVASQGRAGGGFDWIVLNADDLARERDGEPWQPPGGYDTDTADLKTLGVSLGQGGTVRLWPVGAAESPRRPASSEPERTPPTARPNGPSTPPAPPRPTPPPAPTRPPVVS